MLLNMTTTRCRDVLYIINNLICYNTQYTCIRKSLQSGHVRSSPKDPCWCWQNMSHVKCVCTWALKLDICQGRHFTHSLSFKGVGANTLPLLSPSTSKHTNSAVVFGRQRYRYLYRRLTEYQVDWASSGWSLYWLHLSKVYTIQLVMAIFCTWVRVAIEVNYYSTLCLTDYILYINTNETFSKYSTTM